MYLSTSSTKPIPSLSEIKTWWSKNKTVSPPERLFRILADDHREMYQWLSAVKLICTTGSLEMVLLKHHQGPSVSELLNRRFAQFTKMGDAAFRQMDLIDTYEPVNFAATFVTVDEFGSNDPVIQFASWIYHWDPNAALPAIRFASERAYALHQKNIDPDEIVERQVLQMFMHRAELGDETGQDHFKQLTKSWSEAAKSPDFSRA